jgi:HSP20 family protein
MNLIKFNHNPFVNSLLHDLDNDFFTAETKSRGDIPAVNIIEEEKQFILELAVPGMKKEDFKINLENQVLTISKEEKQEKEENKENYSRREFYFNSFSRSFRLPKIVVADKIKADYQNGILMVSLPKDEKATLTRQISVN